MWRLHVYPGLGVERHLNSTGLHTMGTKRLLLVQLIKSTMDSELGSSVVTADPLYPSEKGRGVLRDKLT